MFEYPSTGEAEWLRGICGEASPQRRFPDGETNLAGDVVFRKPACQRRRLVGKRASGALNFSSVNLCHGLDRFNARIEMEAFCRQPVGRRQRPVEAKLHSDEHGISARFGCIPASVTKILSERDNSYSELVPRAGATLCALSRVKGNFAGHKEFVQVLPGGEVMDDTVWQLQVNDDRHVVGGGDSVEGTMVCFEPK
jgi:hypothetical protein